MIQQTIGDGTPGRPPHPAFPENLAPLIPLPARHGISLVPFRLRGVFATFVGCGKGRCRGWSLERGCAFGGPGLRVACHGHLAVGTAPSAATRRASGRTSRRADPRPSTGDGPLPGGGSPAAGSPWNRRHPGRGAGKRCSETAETATELWATRRRRASRRPRPRAGPSTARGATGAPETSKGRRRVGILVVLVSRPGGAPPPLGGRTPACGRKMAERRTREGAHGDDDGCFDGVGGVSGRCRASAG